MSDLGQTTPGQNETVVNEPVEEQVATEQLDPEARIAELTRTLEDREAAIRKLTADLTERENTISSLQTQADLALSKYRGALLSSSPEIPADLITGRTVEEIDASLDKARQIVDSVRQRLESRPSSPRVPGGAPLRTSSDVSNLSPAAKIAYGLARDQR